MSSPAAPFGHHRYTSSADLYATTADDDVLPSRTSLYQQHEQLLRSNDQDDDDQQQPWTMSYRDFRRSESNPRLSMNQPQLHSSDSLKTLGMVKQPTLAKQDWEKGEPTQDLHRKRIQRQQQATQATKQAGSWFARHWKRIALVVLILAVIAGILLAICLPRPPKVKFASSAQSVLYDTDTDPFVSQTYGNYSFKSDLFIDIDAKSSIIPVTFKSFQVTLRRSETNVVLAQGPRAGFTVPGRKSSVYAVPLTWSGSFGDATDPNFVAVYSACGPIYPTVTRDLLNLTMSATYELVGRIGTFTTDRQSIEGVACPVEFSGTAS
ncbi:hypothetical protein OIO90_006257 [Microbotryomycetes sp. JL221]|nr:hypothetical protein OIO90_006257 [Microbotryomycetes sp. JL221]